MIICFILGVLSNLCSYAVDVYLTDFKVSKGTPDSMKIVENSSFSSLLKYELGQLSGDKLAYKGIRQLSESTKRVLKSDYVTSKLDALVICHFEKINYLVFGTLEIDEATNSYKASVQVYSLEKNEIIHQISLDNVAANETDFSKVLSTVIDQDVNKLLVTGIIKEEEIKTAPVVEVKKENTNPKPEEKTNPPPVKEEVKKEEAALVPENNKTPETIPAKEEIKKEEVKPAKEEIKKQEEKPAETEKTATLESVLAKFVTKEEKTENKEGAEEKKPGGKLLSVFTSLGYFVPFTGEWAELIFPCVSIEGGLKLNLYLVDTEGFDFIMRPAAYINYSFALNQEDVYIIHYHTFKLKAGLDCYFEFGNFFAFYAGGTAFYRFDVIDFQNVSSGTFMTDLPTALGAGANLGVEFYLNKEKTFSLGLVNVLDLTFYSTMVVEYQILAQIAFKL